MGRDGPRYQNRKRAKRCRRQRAASPKPGQHRGNERWGNEESHGAGLFAGGFLLIGLAGASGQGWGRSEAPRSGVCFYEHPNFGGRYFCAAIGDSTEMVPEGMNVKISSIQVFGDAEVTV